MTPIKPGLKWTVRRTAASMEPRNSWQLTLL